jgi:hypothetical protein
MSNEIPNYDKWKLDSGQDDEVVFCHCDHCDGEIYEGEEYLDIENGHRIHEDCYDDYAKEVLNPTIRIAGE